MLNHSHRVTFGNNKLHKFVIRLPERKAVKMFLQNMTDLQRMNVSIQDTIICNRRTEDLILSGISFMKIKNKIGLTTTPWGTLDKTGTGSEA